MSIMSRKNLRKKFSIERAYQAMEMRGLSRMATARSMGLINGGSYIKNNDDIGCYKALSKALSDGLMSDEMLDRFCKTVNVDPYVISGEADRDICEIYDLNIFDKEKNLNNYKNSIDLNRYPYNGIFPRLHEDYVPDIFVNDGLIGAYNQFMGFFGVSWLDTERRNGEEHLEIHSKGYYDLMDNILSAVRDCLVDFDKDQQTTFAYKPEYVDNLLNNFRIELYNNNLLDPGGDDE